MTDQLRNIADQAEKDLNSYQAKTGAGKTSSQDDSGVDARAENKFEGAEVKVGEELNTNAGFDKKIPVSEGGAVDDKGREASGKYFEGKGGVEETLKDLAENKGGNDDVKSLES